MFARPGLPAFDYVRARDSDEVVRLLVAEGDGAHLLMGGTDLLPNTRDGRLRPRLVVDVKGVAGMRALVWRRDGGLTAGAAVTMNELAGHPGVGARYPLLAQAAASVASYQVRNRATLGGNLCNASPCADTAPACLVLDAQLVLYGTQGERMVSVGEFLLGPGRTARQPDEFLTAVRFPAPPARSAARYLKLGRCRSGDLSLVGVAVLGYRDGAGGNPHFRIGLGSVASTPRRALEAEAILDGHSPGEAAFAAAAERATGAASPITDVRATAEYQLAMVRTLTLRGLRDVWAQLAG